MKLVFTVGSGRKRRITLWGEGRKIPPLSDGPRPGYPPAVSSGAPDGWDRRRPSGRDGSRGWSAPEAERRCPGRCWRRSIPRCSTASRSACRSARRSSLRRTARRRPRAMAAEILSPRVRLAHNSSGANLLSGVDVEPPVRATARSWGCSRSTRPRCPRSRERVRPAGRLPRESVQGPARPVRRAGARCGALARRRARSGREAVLVVNGDDPQVGDLARSAPRIDRVRARRSAACGPRAPARGRLQVVRSLRSAVRLLGGIRRASRRVPLSGLRARSGRRWTSLPERSSCAAWTVSTSRWRPQGERRAVRLGGARALQRLQRSGGGVARAGARVDPRRRRRRVSSGFGAAFGRFERIAIGDKRLLVLLDQEPGRRERGGADAGRRRRAEARGARAERRDRGRTRRVVDLGRRLRAAARPGSSGSSRPVSARPRWRFAASTQGSRSMRSRSSPSWTRPSIAGLELTPAGGELVVLPTYTAMLALAQDRGRARIRAPVLGACRVTIRVGAPLSRVPEHLRGSRQHRRAVRAARAGAGIELEVEAVEPGRPRPSGRARPLLHRRRAGSRAGADRARSRGAG